MEYKLLQAEDIKFMKEIIEDDEIIFDEENFLISLKMKIVMALLH